MVAAFRLNPHPHPDPDPNPKPNPQQARWAAVPAAAAADAPHGLAVVAGGIAGGGIGVHVSPLHRGPHAKPKVRARSKLRASGATKA